jgi:hypothetical protein
LIFVLSDAVRLSCERPVRVSVVVNPRSV